MAVRKKTVKKSAKKAPSSRRRSVNVEQQKSSSAKYVLTIMILAAAIAFIMSKQTKPLKTTSNKKETVNVKKTEVKDTKKDELIKKQDKPVKKNQSNSDDDANKKISAKVYFIKISDSGSVKYIPVTVSASQKDKFIVAARHTVSVNASEKSNMESAFPAGVKVYDVKVKNRIAYINVSSQIKSNAVGDFLTARLNQLLLTMKSFNEVDGIEILVEGKKINTFGGDGRVISWPLKERL